MAKWVRIEMTLEDAVFIKGALLQAIDNREKVIKNHPQHMASTIAASGIVSYQSALKKVKEAIEEVEGR